MSEPEAPFLARIQPSELYGEMWEFVENGLKAIVEECPTVPWRPDDVRRCLFRGEGALYVRPEGFVICERLHERISGAPYLNVWAIWFAPGTASPLKAQLIEWVLQTGRATCCEWIEGTSTREGWGRALQGVCDVAMVTWRMRP